MRLTVRLRNPQFEVRHRYASSVNIPEFVEYTGEVFPRPKWVADDSFCLTTGNQQFPFRTLDKKNIVHGWRLPNNSKATAYSDKVISVPVVGNKGNSYLVTSDGMNHSCTCTGYSYRKTCTHIEGIIDDCKLIAA